MKKAGAEAGRLREGDDVPYVALENYRAEIALDQPFRPVIEPCSDLPVLARQLLLDLGGGPLGNSGRWSDGGASAATEAAADPARTLMAMLTMRPPGPLPGPAERRLDTVLAARAAAVPAVDAATLPSIADRWPDSRYPAARRCALWNGDLARLRADAVVNAANERLLGCFRPFHGCVDNALHSGAGPRMRADCDRIVRLQGGPETIGTAKATRGYHLPARFVLHTVGPRVNGRPDQQDAAALAACYRSCLDLATGLEGVRTLGFCCVATGEFGYPSADAARVALATVADWLLGHDTGPDLVVFSLHTTADRAAYEQAVRLW